MRRPKDYEKPLTLTLAAKKLGVHKETLRRAILKGELQAFRVTEKGHYRIQTSEIERLLNGRKK